jgi:hypothetical protein
MCRSAPAAETGAHPAEPHPPGQPGGFFRAKCLPSPLQLRGRCGQLLREAMQLPDPHAQLPLRDKQLKCWGKPNFRVGICSDDEPE